MHLKKSMLNVSKRTLKHFQRALTILQSMQLQENNFYETKSQRKSFAVHGLTSSKSNFIKFQMFFFYCKTYFLFRCLNFFFLLSLHEYKVNWFSDQISELIE